MRFEFFSLVALATAVLVVAQPSYTQPLSINPDPSLARRITRVASVSSSEPQTNAERFAKGLPPLAPRFLRRRLHGGKLIGGKHFLGQRTYSVFRDQGGHRPSLCFVTPASCQVSILCCLEDATG